MSSTVLVGLCKTKDVARTKQSLGEWIRTTDFIAPKQGLEKVEAACLLSNKEYTVPTPIMQLSLLRPPQVTAWNLIRML